MADCKLKPADEGTAKQVQPGGGRLLLTAGDDGRAGPCLHAAQEAAIVQRCRLGGGSCTILNLSIAVQHGTVIAQTLSLPIDHHT